MKFAAIGRVLWGSRLASVHLQPHLPYSTSFKSALNYTNVPHSKATFILVRAAGNTKALKRELMARLSGVEVLSGTEFSARTRKYWMFTTGAGAVVLGAAILGLLVGTAVVSQTIYAATLDCLTEYATLKAIGARNTYLCGVLLTQAIAIALIGYAVGILVAAATIYSNRNGPVSMILSPRLAAAVLGLTVVMCCSASLVAIRTVIRVEPAMGCQR